MYYFYIICRFVSESSKRQPDGGNSEGCTFLRLSSIHSIQNWHDVACSYNKINNFICETSVGDLRNGKAYQIIRKVLFVVSFTF